MNWCAGAASGQISKYTGYAVTAFIASIEAIAPPTPHEPFIDKVFLEATER
jgi:hypothetical protein